MNRATCNGQLRSCTFKKVRILVQNTSTVAVAAVCASEQELQQHLVRIEQSFVKLHDMSILATEARLLLLLRCVQMNRN